MLECRHGRRLFYNSGARLSFHTASYLNRFDVALVLSNDTDLVEPGADRDHGGRQAGGPGRALPASPQRTADPLPPSLRAVGSFVLYVDDHHLAGAQFPDPVVRTKGNPVIEPAG